MTDLPSGSGRKQLHVFAIIERKEASKPPYWMKVGTAFPNRDGSLSIYLDAIPLGSNKLQVREPRPRDEPHSGSARRDGQPLEAHP